MDKIDIKNTIIDIFIVSLEAQVRSLKRLRHEPFKMEKRERASMSQIDMVEDILTVSGESLHINEIINRVEKTHNIRIDRESIVSSLTKKIVQKDRFIRTGKNTFDLKGGTK